MARPARPVRERLWEKVDKRTPDECWPWTAGTMTGGYGSFLVTNSPRRNEAAHRVAFTLTHGPIPEGSLVRHTCDNPPCCNPRHLILGDPASNANDRAERGRNKNRRHFTPAEIVAIRADGRSHAVVAADYGITAMSIANLRAGRTYADAESHLPEQERLLAERLLEVAAERDALREEVAALKSELRRWQETIASVKPDPIPEHVVAEHRAMREQIKSLTWELNNWKRAAFGIRSQTS